MLTLTAVAFGEPFRAEVAGTFGETGFLHDHPVSDVVARGDTLLVLAGCEVVSWSRDGTRLGAATLAGCTAGLNHGRLSRDGEWAANAGMWVGESGVWRASGGARVLEVESVTDGELCGGAWWQPSAGGLRRIDLATRAETRPIGERSSTVTCVDDRWLVDGDGRAVAFDGALGPEDDSARVPVGTTGDGRVLVWRYGGAIDAVDAAGNHERALWLPTSPERVGSAGGEWWAVFSGDQAWRFDADGRASAGPFYATDGGLADEPGWFRWGDEAWGWAGRRVFRLAEAVGPVDDAGERFHLSSDTLWVCHGPTCEGAPLADPAAPPRAVPLARRTASGDGASPSGRYLAQIGLDVVTRTDLTTGERLRMALDDWPDEVVADDAGRVRWIEAHDPDEDGVWDQAMMQIAGGSPERLAAWASSELASPGRGVEALAADAIRWTGGAVTPLPGAEALVELAGGRVAAALGTGLVVYGPEGVVAERAGLPDALGPWGDGLWLARGGSVELLGPDLVVRGRLALTWTLDEYASVDGVGSADGRWFAAERPDGRIEVWRTGDAAPAPAPAEVPRGAWQPDPPRLRLGEQLAALPWRLPEVDLPWDDWDADEASLVALTLAAAAPTEEHRLALEALVRSRYPSDDALYELREGWLAARPAVRPAATGVAASDLAAERAATKAVTRLARKSGFAKILAQVDWPAVEATPAFGLAARPSGPRPSGARPRDPAPLEAEGPADGEEIGFERIASVVVRVEPDGSARWVGTGADDDAEEAQRCWRHVDGPWIPATDASGRPTAACVAHRCRFPR